jgi:phage-related protein
MGHRTTPSNSQLAIISTPWNVVIHPLAEVELKSLADDLQARFVWIAELLESFGPQHVGLPHIRPLENKLWEMRMTGRDGIARAIYAAVQNRRLLVLHVFVKKTQTTPRRALQIAYQRLETRP